MGMLILDRNGSTIFSSGTISFGKRTAARTDGEVFGFADADDDRADRFVGAGFALESGWRAFVYQPLVELESALIWDYLIILAGLAMAVMISMAFARKLAADYAAPIEALDRAISEFDLNMSPKQTQLSSNTPQEILSVFRSLGELDNRLRTAYGSLRKSVHQGEKLRGELIYVIANREKEIKQRTQELKEANETLERLSREDSLTGLANRRWFAEFLARTWRRAVREKQPVSVLIIDIDNFKAYNDTYGHQKGDMCLKLVAEAIRRSVGRATDLVSRYGGEEFIVVLGDTPLDGALQIAEEIRATVENLNIPHKGAEFHPVVTVSIGATSTLPSADMQPETFLVAADRAMYRAKNDGKNQVAYSTSARTGVYQALCRPDEAGGKRLS
jgi:diguanylate cyclase (GGDEF)-like protein